MKKFIFLLFIIPSLVFADDAQLNQWLNPSTHKIMTGGQLRYKLQNSDIVLVGETHDSTLDRSLQFEILAKMYNLHKDVVLAMQMFCSCDQKWLDKWQQKEISTEELLKNVNWKKSWPVDFGLYKPIMEFARDNNITIVGIRPDDKLISDLRKLKHSREFPKLGLKPIYTVTRSYINYLELIYTSTRKNQKDVADFVLRQVSIDAVMARNIALYSDKKMIVMASLDKVVFGWGIETQLKNYTDQATVLKVMPVYTNIPTDIIPKDIADVVFGIE